MRRYDDPPITGQKYQHRPGAYGVFTIKGGVLLTGQISKDLEWQLPGGGIDQGESPGQALIREAYEETGWLVSISRKIGCYKRYVFMPEYDMHAEKICHIYAGRAVIRKGDPVEKDHISAIVPPDLALEILINQGDRDLLAQFLSA